MIEGVLVKVSMPVQTSRTTKKQVGKERVCSAYTSSLLSDCDCKQLLPCVPIPLPSHHDGLHPQTVNQDDPFLP